MKWIQDYQKYGVLVSFNNVCTNTDMGAVFDYHFVYLPNIYPLDEAQYHHRITDSAHVDIGCFGALRILKNQLSQAIAAIVFADKIHKKLKFHINLNETADMNTAIHKNLHALFENNKHKLVIHRWVPHDDFLDVVRTMDLGMQVSFSESFNIVSADFVFCGVPIVVSKEIDWLPPWCWAENTTESMVGRLSFAWKNRGTMLQKINWEYLNSYNRSAGKQWKHYLGVDEDG
jgi:hypothetical protein